MPVPSFFTFYVYFTISSNARWKNQALYYDNELVKPEVVLCGNPFIKEKSANKCALKAVG